MVRVVDATEVLSAGAARMVERVESKEVLEIWEAAASAALVGKAVKGAVAFAVVVGYSAELVVAAASEEARGNHKSRSLVHSSRRAMWTIPWCRRRTSRGSEDRWCASHKSTGVLGLC